jgi:hypothetical protein
MQSTLQREVAAIATAAGRVEDRAAALLEPMRRWLPHIAAAWIAVRDPETRLHRPVAVSGDTDALARYFAGPEADAELERLGLNRARPPVRACDLAVPLGDITAWGDFLLPAGFCDGFAVGLFSRDGRQLGFLSLLSLDAHPTEAEVDLISSVRPLVAMALDRMPGLSAAAEMTGAIGGVAVTRSGHMLTVPGLAPHPVVTPPAPAFAVARRHPSGSSFLCPSADGLVRVIVVDCRDERADHVVSLVMVRPRGDLAGVRPVDLDVLGAVFAGWPDERIGAVHGLGDVPRYLAELAWRLELPTVDELLRYAAREGLFVPPELALFA